MSHWLRLFSPLGGVLPQGQAGSDKLLPALHPGREAVPEGRADRKKQSRSLTGLGVPSQACRPHKRPPARAHRPIMRGSLRHTLRTALGRQRQGPAPRKLRYSSWAVYRGQTCVAPSLWARKLGSPAPLPGPLPESLLEPSPLSPPLPPSPTSAFQSCLPLPLCPLSPHLSSLHRQAGTRIQVPPTQERSGGRRGQARRSGCASP